MFCTGGVLKSLLFVFVTAVLGGRDGGIATASDVRVPSLILPFCLFLLACTIPLQSMFETVMFLLVHTPKPLFFSFTL